MKKITKQFLYCALSFAALTFVSCNDDDYTNDSTLPVVSGVVGTTVLVSPLAATQTVNEEDEGEYSFKVTLNEAQSIDVVVEVIQSAGDAVVGEDFDFSTSVTIPAYSLEGTGTIEIINNCASGNSPSFTLQVGTVTSANATVNPTNITFNVTNDLQQSLDLAFNFNKPFSISGVANTLCGIGYDMDFLAYDENLELVPDYAAATGACVESINLDQTLFPDGTYYMVYDIYDDAGLSNAYHDPFVIPITVDYSRCGSPSIQGSYVLDGEGIAPSSTDGSGQGLVVGVLIENGVYTLVDVDDEIIATGKMANKIKADFALARKNRK